MDAFDTPARTLAPGCRVLCIDDHAANRHLVDEMLRQQGVAECRLAESAEQGLDQALRDPPDLILLDLNLPIKNGFQVMSALQAEPALASIPVVAVTADATDATRERVEQAGFSALLLKPIGAAELAGVLARCRGSTPAGDTE